MIWNNNHGNLVLFALNKHGVLKWKTNVEVNLFEEHSSNLAIGPDGTIYCNSGYLYAFNQDGSRKWINKEGWGNYPPIIGPDGTIYSDDVTYLRANNPDGRLIWKFNTGQFLEHSPTMGPDGTIYVGSVRTVDYSPGMSYLYAIDKEGQLKWKLGTHVDTISQSAVGKDGTIYYGSRDGYLYSIASNGSMRWRFKEGNELYYRDSSPAIGPDGTIYFGSEDNFLYAINPDGNLKWKLHLYGSVGSPVISADGILFVTSSTVYLYAIDSNDVRTVDGTVVNGLKWIFDTDYNSPELGVSMDYGYPVIGANDTVYLGCFGSFDDPAGWGRLLAIGTNESDFGPGGILAPPSNLNATVNGTSGMVNLSWDPSANNGSSQKLSYGIYRYSHNNSGGPCGFYRCGTNWVGETYPSNQTYCITGPIYPNTTYYYWIFAIFAGPSYWSNRSLPSQIITVTTPPGTATQANISPGNPPPLPILFMAPPPDPREITIKNAFLTGIVILTCTIIGILGLSSESFSYIIRPMAMMLFSRKKKEEVLDNFFRGQLYRCIVDNPGINLGELKKKVNSSIGTVVYHLKTLERDGLIKSYRDGLYRLFFPSSMKVPWEFMELTEPQRTIYRLVKENPGISQRGIASKTDMSPPKIHRNVHGLASKGFIRIEKGRRTRLYPIDN
jgi:outer membrane protein assembly factor BamB/predicted transcriptional regulator